MVVRAFRTVVGIAALSTAGYAQIYLEQPWFGDFLQIQGHFTYTLEHFRNLETTHGKERLHSFSHLLDAGTSLAVDPWELGAELGVAETTIEGFYFDHFELIGRYRFLDDIQGDPLSVVAGLKLAATSSQALHDPSFFHHSYFDSELYLSLGKETSYEENWTGHYWALGGIGMGVKGSPWTHAILSLEHQFIGRHALRLMGEFFAGLGSRRLTSTAFPGYAHLRHHSLDVSGAYTYRLDSGIALSVGYGQRVYARSCPDNAQFFTFYLFYPFDL